MDTPESSTKKRIPLSQLKPGMYVVELDRAWIHTPFLFDSRRIRNAREIELLAKHGVQEVIIDPARGTEADLAKLHAVREPVLDPCGKTSEPAEMARGESEN